MLLSICIVNWNTREYLHECLTALNDAPLPGGEMEVIVVDNASTDGSAEMVKTEFPAVRLIVNKDNAGYARGNNQAFKASSGEYLLLLNPDVIVHKDSLKKAVKHMGAYPKVAALGCRLLSPDGTTQLSIRGFPDPLPVLSEYLGLSKLMPSSHYFGGYRMAYFNYDTPAEVDQPMGSFLMISRKALRDVGDMDEQFPIFFNEVDWCYRAKRHKGWLIHYTHDVEATHYGGGSTKQAKARMIQESHQSLLRFYEKHYRIKMSPLAYWLIRRAVLIDESRALARAERAGPKIAS